MERLEGIVQDAGYQDEPCTYGKVDDNTLYYFIKDYKLANGNIIATTNLKEAIGHATYTQLGVINPEGKVLIPFENKTIKPIKDNLLLVEKNVPTKESVVNALKNRSDPFIVQSLSESAATIKKQMKDIMGLNGDFIFDNQFSECAIYTLDGINVANDYFSFIGENNGDYYLATNVVGATIMKFNPNQLETPATDDSQSSPELAVNPPESAPQTPQATENLETQLPPQSQTIPEENSQNNGETIPEDNQQPNIDIPVQTMAPQEQATETLPEESTLPPNTGESSETLPNTNVNNDQEITLNIANDIPNDNNTPNPEGENVSSNNDELTPPPETENFDTTPNSNDLNDDPAIPEVTADTADETVLTDENIAENESNDLNVGENNLSDEDSDITVEDTTDDDNNDDGVTDDDTTDDDDSDGDVTDDDTTDDDDNDDGVTDDDTTDDDDNDGDVTDDDTTDADDSDGDVTDDDTTDDGSASDTPEENTPTAGNNQLAEANELVQKPYSLTDEDIATPTIRDATNIITKLLEENRNLRLFTDKQSGEIEALKSEIEILKAEDSSSKQEIDSLRSEMEKYRTESIQSARKITKLEGGIEHLMETNESLRNQNEGLRKQVGGMKALSDVVGKASNFLVEPVDKNDIPYKNTTIDIDSYLNGNYTNNSPVNSTYNGFNYLGDSSDSSIPENSGGRL